MFDQATDLRHEIQSYLKGACHEFQGIKKSIWARIP